MVLSLTSSTVSAASSSDDPCLCLLSLVSKPSLSSSIDLYINTTVVDLVVIGFVRHNSNHLSFSLPFSGLLFHRFHDHRRRLSYCLLQQNRLRPTLLLDLFFSNKQLLYPTSSELYYRCHYLHLCFYVLFFCLFFQCNHLFPIKLRGMLVINVRLIPIKVYRLDK